MSKLLISCLFSLSVVALAAFSCNRQSPSKVEKRTEARDDAEFAVSVKRAEADSIWKAMVASDDKKIANTGYFLSLFAYTMAHDSMSVDSVKQANAALAAQRYSQANVRELVDKYDTAQNKVLQGIGQLFMNNTELQRMVNAENALVEIKAADDSVLIFRVMYDNAAQAYNQALEGNKKALKETKELQPLPLFRINT
jgi:hypothetical protein